MPLISFPRVLISTKMPHWLFSSLLNQSEGALSRCGRTETHLHTVYKNTISTKNYMKISSHSNQKRVSSKLFVVDKDINKILTHFWSSHYRNQYGGFGRERLKIPQDPTEFLEIYPKELISILKRSLPALVAHFTIAKLWSHPLWPLTKEMDKMWSTCTVEENEVISFARK